MCTLFGDTKIDNSNRKETHTYHSKLYIPGKEVITHLDTISEQRSKIGQVKIWRLSADALDMGIFTILYRVLVTLVRTITITAYNVYEIHSANIQKRCD